MEYVEYEIRKVISEHGKSRMDIKCPFCGALFWAYNWSLSANGKKCDGCGAIHYTSGARKRKGDK